MCESEVISIVTSEEEVIIEQKEDIVLVEEIVTQEEIKTDSFDFDKRIEDIYPKLLGWSKKFYWDYDNQVDLVSETVCKILQSKDKFDGNQFGGWCYRIMHNLFVNDYRLSELRRGDDIVNYENTFVADNLPNLFSHKELLKDIEKYFRGRNKDGYNLILEWASGYTYEELAEKYALALGTVKSRIFKARQEILENFTLN